MGQAELLANGMNFDFMPETKWVYGYPVAVLAMLTICGLLYRWFRKVKWLYQGPLRACRTEVPVHQPRRDSAD
ncbi:MAG: hypothetical protein JNL18_02885 [Planctomycetaceae bacterium]|nr:hypothetical protein [Planctomycetaceae bacterium]